jgi:hypothetical protein
MRTLPFYPSDHVAVGGSAFCMGIHERVAEVFAARIRMAFDNC